MNAQDFVAKWRKIVATETTPDKRFGEGKPYALGGRGALVRN